MVMIIYDVYVLAVLASAAIRIIKIIFNITKNNRLRAANP